MLDIRNLRVGQIIQMMTCDVSGSYIIPCEVLDVNDTEAIVATCTGVQVFISKSNESEFFLDESSCLAVMNRESRKCSFWN